MFNWSWKLCISQCPLYGQPLVTGGFPAQRATYVASISMPWFHDVHGFWVSFWCIHIFYLSYSKFCINLNRSFRIYKKTFKKKSFGRFTCPRLLGSEMCKTLLLIMRDVKFKSLSPLSPCHTIMDWGNGWVTDTIYGNSLIIQSSSIHARFTCYMYVDVRQFSGIYAGISLGVRPANEIRRYNVTTSLIGWAHT